MHRTLITGMISIVSLLAIASCVEDVDDLPAGGAVAADIAEETRAMPNDELLGEKETFTDQKAAASEQCKSGLTNVFSNPFITARVVTDWCYRGGNVASRHSVPSSSVTNLGYVLGWRKGPPEWKYSACHSYNGYPKHNCLTRMQFTFHNISTPLLPPTGVCIHTRIYGNGDHNRDITTNCP